MWPICFQGQSTPVSLAWGLPLPGVVPGSDCPFALFSCRASLTLSDFELVRRLGDGSYSQVIMARLK